MLYLAKIYCDELKQADSMLRDIDAISEYPSSLYMYLCDRDCCFNVFSFVPVWMIRNGFSLANEAIERKRRRTQVFRERVGEFVEALPGTILCKDLLFKTVRVLIAQSIRARALSGAKKKSLNGDLLLFFFPFFLVFFCLFCHRSPSRIAAPTTIDRLCRSMQNSRFCDKKTLRDNDDRKL